MVKISERAAALVGERQQVVEISQANERRLEERVREEGQRAQQAERRYCHLTTIVHVVCDLQFIHLMMDILELYKLKKGHTTWRAH